MSFDVDARSERTLSATAQQGANPLLKHGFLQVSANGRHFEHADGTPFFWLDAGPRRVDSGSQGYLEARGGYRAVHPQVVGSP